MKVILYMAISVNGNITYGKSNSDWVDKADWEYFNKTTKEAGVMVMGSETYKQFKDDFPQKQAFNVVLTKKKSLLNKKVEGAMFTNMDLKGLLKNLEAKGYKSVCFIGGEKLNTTLFKEDLVDELYVDVHPYLIGDGLRIFGKISKMFKKLKLVDTKKLKNDLVLLHYKVIK